ncbi:MAG: ABC transporter permease [Acidobacteriota bacterium]
MNIPLKYNIRSVLQRRSRTALTVLGIAAVVSVFTAMVALGRGMSASFAASGSPDNLVVLQKGAFSQSLSSLPRSSRDVVLYAPHLKKVHDRTLVSPELAIEPWVTAPGKRDEIFMVVRGIEPVYFEVEDTIKILRGTAELRGNRVLVGRAAQHKLGGVGIGQSVGMFGERWTVTGLFETGGSSLEFGVLADREDLMRASRRDELSCYTLKLDNPGNAGAVIVSLEGDRRVLLTAMPEQEYYQGSGRVFAIVAQLGLMIAWIVTLGAVFGGMNTMYTAVAGRMREIGTLRAIGFSRNSILLSFLAESVLLSLTGGVLGVALGFLADGLRLNVMTASVRFTVGPGVMLSGLALSLVVGLLGGLLPARGAARLAIVEAMRRI